MNQKIISTILLLFLISIARSFILRLPPQPWKKCYYAQHSPDKTLQVRTGFFKKQLNPCLIKFTVFFKDGAHQIVQRIHEKNQSCQQGRFRDTYTVKHTSDGYTSQLVTGYYQICVEVIENPNLDVFVEVFIGQSLNPIIYEHSDHPLPLVQAKELLDLDLTAQSIKRGLTKSQIHAQSIKIKGDDLDIKIASLQNLSKAASIIQIIILLIFGMVWIYLVKRLKNKT